MKRFYQTTAIVCGIKMEETGFWSASPKRAGASFMEEVGDDLINGYGAVGHEKNGEFSHPLLHIRREQLRDLFGGDRKILIQVQRLGDVGSGLELDDQRPVGKPRHYTWNGLSTTTRNGHIPDLQAIAKEGA